MAEEEEERIYTVPLRTTKSTPRSRRGEHAVRELKRYIAKHMKGDIRNVWIDEPVNRKLWANGIEHPPSKIRVKAIKFEDDLIEVSIPEEE
jgi:large subunit ribosomal protein L31e